RDLQLPVRVERLPVAVARHQHRRVPHHPDRPRRVPGPLCDLVELPHGRHAHRDRAEPHRVPVLPESARARHRRKRAEGVKPVPDLVTPDWLADAVFYQIFPERFANGDPTLDPPGVEPWDAAPTRENFFGGDLAGITQHLDHLVSIGVNAIYLTPIFQADTNHRYDATDYFAIDHRLGDLDAFRVFVREAHARGIRIVLDAVLNHCGEGHPMFRDVMRNEADSEYVNWFSVEGFPVVQHPEPNYRTCSGCWYLPKWNAYNPEVRAHHLDVARHWIAEGIDGWRLDVPYFINHTLWREFRQVVKGLGDELYIVAEEWRDPGEWLQGDLADGTMNYTLRDLVLGFTADRTIDAAAFASGMNELTERIPQPARRAML